MPSGFPVPIPHHDDAAESFSARGGRIIAASVIASSESRERKPPPSKPSRSGLGRAPRDRVPALKGWACGLVLWVLWRFGLSGGFFLVLVMVNQHGVELAFDLDLVVVAGSRHRGDRFNRPALKRFDLL